MVQKTRTIKIGKKNLLSMSEIPELWDLFQIVALPLYSLRPKRFKERVAKDPSLFNMKFILQSKRFEKQKPPKLMILPRNCCGTATCQPCVVRLHHQCLQIVSSLSLCHYYPYINLYLCKLNSVTKNLLQTICSFFLLLFDVQISSLFFLLISLEMHMIILL